MPTEVGPLGPTPVGATQQIHNGFRFYVFADGTAHLHHMTDLTFAMEHVLDRGVVIRTCIVRDSATWHYVVELVRASGVADFPVQPATSGATLGVALRIALGTYLYKEQ